MKSLSYIPVVNNMKTADNIRKLKNLHECSYSDLQNACMLESHQSVYKWLNGQSIPSIDNLLILSQLFETSIDEIIGVDYISVMTGEVLCT